MIARGIAGIPDILGALTQEFAALLRTELRLAQAEISDKANDTAMALIPAAVGALLLIPALVILLGAVVAVLMKHGIDATLSFAIVGGATLVIASILIFVAIQRVQALSLAPRRTVRQLHRDVDAVKSQVGAS